MECNTLLVFICMVSIRSDSHKYFSVKFKKKLMRKNSSFKHNIQEPSSWIKIQTFKNKIQESSS